MTTELRPPSQGGRRSDNLKRTTNPTQGTYIGDESNHPDNDRFHLLNESIAGM
jgi:hypothetical protein